MPDPGMSPQDCWQDKKPEARVRKVLSDSTVSGKVTKQGGLTRTKDTRTGTRIEPKGGVSNSSKIFF